VQADEREWAVVLRTNHLIRDGALRALKGLKASILSFMAWTASGECPCQSVHSPVTRSGSRERYDFVGLPGYFCPSDWGHP